VPAYHQNKERRTEQFDEFVANPFGADEFDFGRIALDSGPKRFCGSIFKNPVGANRTARSKRNMVLGEPLFRPADGADDFRA